MNDKINTNKLIDIIQHINPKQIDAYVSRLLMAKKVFFVGMGSILIGLESHVEKLRSLEIDAYLVGASNEPTIDDKDLLVVACGPGETLFPQQITAMARTYGAQVVYLSYIPSQELSQLADDVVNLFTKQQTEADTSLTTRDAIVLFDHQVQILAEYVVSQIAEKKASARNNIHING